MLYQMVSGRPPFRAPNTMAVLKRVTEETPRPISEIIPETPQWLCDIIAKLHAKNPEKRYQSAREVADLLAECETKLKASASMTEINGPSNRMPTSTLRWVLMTATIVIGIVIALGLYDLSSQRSETKLEPTTQAAADDVRPEQAQEPVAPEAERWVQLFNGKDLTGWKFHPDHSGNWDVQDGVLRGHTRQSHLFSERGDYRDFHLRAEVKINQGGDSGILFRAPFELQQGRTPIEFGVPGHYEAEVQQNPQHMRPTGSISEGPGNAPPTNLGQAVDRSLTRPDEWFTIELIAQSNHFISRINGVEVVNCIDRLDRHQSGHLALQVWNPNTLVQFRKVEIKELEPSASQQAEKSKRLFASDEWIDVVPLIDPQIDKWDVPQRTGKNAWRIEQGELVVGGDTLGSKLVLPLDSDWPAFECELEFTRRAGDSGINVDLPAKAGECPVVVDAPGTPGGVWFGSRTKGTLLKEGRLMVTGQRSTVRIEVRRQQNGEHATVSVNNVTVGEWTGDRNAISNTYKQGFPQDRRISLWIHPGGNEFVFHRIRIRMLDGGTAESLRPVPSQPQIARPPLAVAPFDDAQAKVHQEAWAKYLGVPVEYTNSIGMKFRLIPPGEFTMGMTQEDAEEITQRSNSDERANDYVKMIATSSFPSHRVRLTKPFYLGVHEVTQQQYESVVGNNPSYFSTSGDGKELVEDEVPQQHPVETVTFFSAADFCIKLSEREQLNPAYSSANNEIKARTGDGYCLPTEAEWEHACRAGTETAWFCGNREATLKTVGWYGVNSSEKTHRVGQLRENAFGLFDVHGNVWEWCQDILDLKAYAQRGQGINVDPQGPGVGAARVLRGGDWMGFSSIACSALRNHAAEDYVSHTIGFRVALPVDAVKAAIVNRTPTAQKANTGWHGWPVDAPPPAIAPFDAAQAKAHQEAWAKHLGVPLEYTNSIGMKFRLIPPGEFMMGSSPAEIAEAMIAAGNDDNWKTHLKSEEPQHKVVLTQPYYLGVHEVTQDEYQRIVGKNPSFFAESGNGKDRVAGLQTSRFPVEQVTWTDATAFAKKLGQSELGTADAYYLPTEAQWEFACRAGTQTKYSFGDADSLLSEHGRHNTSRTNAVGELKPNAFQLHDMHGNVWEWVHDLWDTQYYSSFANAAAQNPRGPQAAHDRRVTRGGCWANPPSSCRSAHRITEPEGTWGFILGFRLALSVDAVKTAKAQSRSAAVAPFADADVQRIAALPATEQVEEVRKELKKRNPDFNGTLTPTIENDVVTGLEFFTQHVTDISPVRAFRHLTSLNCRGDGATAGMVSNLTPLKGMQLTRLTLSVNPISDLTPLHGMPLTDLHVDNSNVSDLSPLEGMPLKELNCSYTKVASLAPLKGMRLNILWANNTDVSDLSPVKGMPLEWTTIHGTKITDLSPLKGMPLTQIYLDFQPQRDTELLRSIRTLEKINDKPAAEFWKANDAKD